jgi:hypothetical protein
MLSSTVMVMYRIFTLNIHTHFSARNKFKCSVLMDFIDHVKCNVNTSNYGHREHVIYIKSLPTFQKQQYLRRRRASRDSDLDLLKKNSRRLIQPR